MTIWRPEHGRASASAQTLEILEIIEKKMLAYGVPSPSVKSIRIGNELRYEHDFQVEVELAPGVVIAVKYQMVDAWGRDPDGLEYETSGVTFLVGVIVKELFELGVAALADQLHDLRVRTRMALEEWRRDGINVALADIRFVFTEYYRLPRELEVEASFRSLDAYLRPGIATFRVEHPDLFMAKLPTWRQDFETPFAMQAALGRQGADGVVDRLVLNALPQGEDAGDVWRQIASGHQYWDFKRLHVNEIFGHVNCHGWAADESFRWDSSQLTFRARAFPALSPDRRLEDPSRASSSIRSCRTT